MKLFRRYRLRRAADRYVDLAARMSRMDHGLARQYGPWTHWPDSAQRDYARLARQRNAMHAKMTRLEATP